MSDEIQPFTLEFETSGTVSKIKLTKEQGNEIKALIQAHYNCSFPWYCQLVAIKGPNFYNVVNGERLCTLEFLNKLLSGINYQVTATQMLHIHPMPSGAGAFDVNLLSQEDVLHLNGEGDRDEYD